MTATARTPVRFKTIALPTEHGGWSFLLEPALLGLLVAPSASAVLLGLAALAAFLIRHPFELALTDWRRKKRYPRTGWAERFAAAYVLVALIAFVLAALSAQYPFYVPLLMAIPLALVQFYFDVRKQSRALLAELCGAAALGAVAPLAALAAGWTLTLALPLWVIVIVRAVTSILYVQVRLRLDRDPENADWRAPIPIWLVHIAGLIVLSALAALGLVPWLAALAMGLLCVRAFWFLSPYHRPARAPIVGMQETVFGLINVGLVALGYALKL